MSRVGLRRGVRLVHDQARDQRALLYPEGVLLLNETAGAVLGYCDGRRDVAAIAEALQGEYEGVTAEEVSELVGQLTAERLVDIGEPAGTTAADPGAEAVASVRDRAEPMPLGMLAELTYRCPLRCPYCSNPVQLSAYRDELDTADWRRLLGEARELGVLQVHLSGGEPLARRDLVELVAYAHRLGMYTNLITSGVGLTEPLTAELAAAGLDHVQLSIQDSNPDGADAIAGIRAHQRKRIAAGLIIGHGLPMTVNAVLHRANIDHLMPIAELAAELGAVRLELAHTQFYGWGMVNRASLLPTPDQVRAADIAIAEVRRRWSHRMVIGYVRADYYDGVPKPCMQGWGSRQFVIAPNGDVLPCPAAAVIDDLHPANVAEAGLAEIWYASAAFNRFRGTEWMSDPCRSCPRREVDFGGCRCQAYQLTGDAAATDPACRLSPHRDLVDQLLDESTRTVVPSYRPRRFIPLERRRS
ncbi:MAG: pyrroloquinoline quinone biosynthesis protein PqqE [Micromonosporaceae bacterium]